jgi:hypothetical protein
MPVLNYIPRHENVKEAEEYLHTFLISIPDASVISDISRGVRSWMGARAALEAEVINKF